MSSFPLRFQEPANAEIAKYIASGIIVPCEEPTEWCFPAFLCPKVKASECVWSLTIPSSIGPSFAPFIHSHRFQTLSRVYLRLLLVLLSWMRHMVTSKFLWMRRHPDSRSSFCPRVVTIICGLQWACRLPRTSGVDTRTAWWKVFPMVPQNHANPHNVSPLSKCGVQVESVFTVMI